MKYMSEVLQFPTPIEAEETFSRLAELRAAKISIPRSKRYQRADVVNAFTAAFELIGGTNRLALWANDNPTEFYRIFGKLLPSSSITQLLSHQNPNDYRTIPTEELERMLADRTYDSVGVHEVDQDEAVSA